MSRTLSLACQLAVLALVSATIAPAQALDPNRIRPGKWSKNEIPDGWVVYNSKHYQVQSQAGKDKAKRLARHMEQMIKLYKKTFPPGKDGFIKKPIKLFKDRQSYLDYDAPPGAAAYYTWVPNREMVCYDTGKWQDQPEEGNGPTTGDGKPTRKELYDRLLKRSQMDLLGVMSHEGWHQYFHWYVVSKPNMPSWINEGMGDYFYCAVPPYGKNGKAKGKVQLGRMNPTRLPIIQAAVRQNRHVPLKQIIRYTQRQYYSNPGVCYAEGWALCHFLLHHKKKKIRKIIPKYIRLVKDDSNMDTVTKKAFKGVDFDELEAEWKAWVLAQKLPGQEELEKAIEEAEKDEMKKAIDAAVDKAKKKAGAGSS